MSQRKLLQEIDKVFKKVKEGLEIFDGYYDKLQNCESQSQKEKIEGDLKREIKKLQRQRDQIKIWLSGNEVKEKNQLSENRRAIENAMERFKVVEKNMKTKAFSKEGLSMQRIDPKEREKNETSEFLHQMIEELERQCEKLEANIDQIHSSSKKGKKLDSHKQQQVDECNEKLARHHWHQEKLEQILRYLANDALEVEQINNLQEDIRYYVESNEDADFGEDEGIYDELGLEDFDDTYGNVGDYPNEPEPEPAPPSSASSNQPVAQIIITGNNTPRKNATKTVPIQSTASVITSTSSIASTPAPSSTNNKPTSPGLSTVPSSGNLMPNLKPSVAPKTELKYSSVVSSGVTQAVQSDNTPTLIKAQLSSVPVAQATSTSTTSVRSSVSPINTNATLKKEEPSATSTVAFNDNENGKDESETSNPYEDLLHNFEKVKQSINNPRSFNEISKYLETSLLNCPDSLDSDKPKRYEPANPHPTTLAFPQEPLTDLGYSSVVGKMDESTLFFNFYYEQGQYLQILSARGLVSRGWKFDKFSQKWFKEIEEIKAPTANSNTVEKVKSWKYFDNEDVWLPRRKEDFDINGVELETEFN